MSAPHRPFPGVSADEALSGSRLIHVEAEGPMTRIRALELATAHVDTLATNGRGYQDGVKLADKVAAVETLARFLIEGDALRAELPV